MKNKVICTECQNEMELGELLVGDTCSCEFCGAEYRVTGKKDDGAYILELIEEEK